METRQAKLRASVVALTGLTLLLGAQTTAPGTTTISSVPFKITSPGPYVLSRDLSMTAPDQNAITVEANDVTIDLMGYSISGRGTGKGNGIFMSGRENIEIRNGTVLSFGGCGILEAKYWTQDSPASGYGHRVISVRVLYNGSAGIDLEGYNHLVKDCTCLQNGLDGIYAGNSSLATGNVSNANGNDGIGLGNGCLAFNNVTASNTWYGMWAWDGCTVLNNTCNYNSYGIYVEGQGALISGNTIRESDSDGIHVKGTGNVLEGNLVTNSDNGIYFEASGNFYVNNRASQNTTDFTGPGLPTGSPGDGGGNAAF